MKIYLADDHEIVAKAIANLLLSLNEITDVKTFSNGKSLYLECLDRQPDLIMLDMKMPEWNGMDTLKKLKGITSVPVIMLTMNDEKKVIEESIKEGAKGYLHKNCTLEELEAAVNTVLSGNIFLSEDTKKILVGIKQHPRDELNGIQEILTEKDLEVLKLVCDGLTSKEIGEKLFLSPRTVETRKTVLMQKFNVQTTGKLIAVAIKNKIVM
ncbi:MAG: two component transcriptional regulator, LuxR family [Bacteroidetes bacterium]|jgi:DNA-binding NarL/FixJ family response regulator|nr:two component transcriptional regulator, LuxR family [Bacteroidota bacterium]MDF2453587.1 two component transcriptional regulator, LuxR family [Bacteroidota bacterium]